MSNSIRRVSDLSTAYFTKEGDQYTVELEYKSESLNFKIKRAFGTRRLASDFYRKMNAQTEQQFLQLIFG